MYCVVCALKDKPKTDGGYIIEGYTMCVEHLTTFFNFRMQYREGSFSRYIQLELQ